MATTKKEADEIAALQETVKEFETKLEDQIEIREEDFPMVIVDLGKTRRKRIKSLKKGKGKLVDEVRDAVDEVSANLDLNPEQTLLPVVLIYRKKSKGKNWKIF